MKRLVLLFLLALGACSSMKVEDFAQGTPQLRLEEYFAGRTLAGGMFVDRFGTVRRQFTVVINGTWDGTTLTLVEDFNYADGEISQRVWHLTKTGDRTWEGRADDVLGVALGAEAGNAFRFGYHINLKVGESQWEVRFDDWMFRLDDTTVLNKADVYRWGLYIGTVQIGFRKP